MIFQINVRNSVEGRVAYVSWQQKRSPKLKSILGPFRYFHFLQDLFEDLSKHQRTGEMSFSKPGLSDLCISWKIDDNVSSDSLFPTLIAGINRINNIRRNSYLRRYSIANVFRIINTDYELNYSGPFTVIGKAWLENPMMLVPSTHQSVSTSM